MRFLFATSALLALVAASPALEQFGGRAANPSAFCSKVRRVITSANQASAATAFCSSYLHLPAKTTVTSTSTVTTTSTSVKNTITGTTTTTAPAVTSTVTTTTTIDSTDTEVVTDTTTSTQTVTLSNPQGCQGPGGAKKRSASKPKPSCFSSYSSGSLLSSACSCLSIAGGTATSTLTTTSSVATTVTSGSQSTVTSTPTSTTTTTVTDNQSATITSTTTVSVVATATTTQYFPETPYVFRLYGSPNEPAAGQYAEIATNNGNVALFDTDSAGSAIFQLEDDGTLDVLDSTTTQLTILGSAAQFGPDSAVEFQQDSVIQDGGATYLNCNVEFVSSANTICQLVCTTTSSDQEVCGESNEWYLGATCSGFTPYIDPVND